MRTEFEIQTASLGPAEGAGKHPRLAAIDGEEQARPQIAAPPLGAEAQPSQLQFVAHRQRGFVVAGGRIVDRAGDDVSHLTVHVELHVGLLGAGRTGDCEAEQHRGERQESANRGGLEHGRLLAGG